jgi:hypothetical protein
MFHERSKHIEIKYYFIRDMVQRGSVRIQFMITEDQVADVFAKPFSRTKFKVRVLQVQAWCGPSSKGVTGETHPT